MRPCSTPILKFEMMKENQSKRQERKSNLLETEGIWCLESKRRKYFKEEGNDAAHMLLMGQTLSTDHWISKMDIFGEFTKSV